MDVPNTHFSEYAYVAHVIMNSHIQSNMIMTKGHFQITWLNSAI